jgi:2-isopropylmalate synthase
LRRIDQAVRRAADGGATVQFSAEDATRADRVFLRQCVETAVCAGAVRVNVPDTVGFAAPEEYGEMVGEIVRFVGDGVIVSAHCHDDLGLATANTIAAVRNGAKQVEVAVNGIGERAGNAALEEVAAVLEAKRVADTGVRLEAVQRLSRCVAEETGVAVAPNHPVVGEHAFAHSSGIHQDGILKHRATYEFLAPETVGAGEHRFVFTARSGRSAVAHCIRGMGFAPKPEEMDAVYRRFLSVADVQMGAVPRSTIAAIASEVCGPAMS